MMMNTDNTQAVRILVGQERFLKNKKGFSPPPPLLSVFERNGEAKTTHKAISFLCSVSSGAE
ncbi:hypothetical protein C0Q70_11573 [Pomacea canaliculata]|uniref:Uncharacterized protein n=1 Tax=Pomacea canaliculata TaxID=400727 RepID=A0A2T7P6G3_POMCA|nr:hypothetical protein C0Q70_11573 [Pomacea canaliculata]